FDAFQLAFSEHAVAARVESIAVEELAEVVNKRWPGKSFTRAEIDAMLEVRWWKGDESELVVRRWDLVDWWVDSIAVEDLTEVVNKRWLGKSFSRAEIGAMLESIAVEELAEVVNKRWPGKSFSRAEIDAMLEQMEVNNRVMVASGVVHLI
ncbi:unnamed protein product, partial [Closterium sp. NIES-53]